MSAAWDDINSGSSVARHEWKGLSKMPGPGALEDWVEKRRLETGEEEDSPRPRGVRVAAARYRLPGAYLEDLLNADEDDEDDPDWFSEEWIDPD